MEQLLSDPRKLRIQQHLPKLVDSLRTDGLLPRLISAGVITTSQREDIDLPSLGQSKKNERLLEHIRRGSMEDYNHFVICLREDNQPHMAKLLLDPPSDEKKNSAASLGDKRKLEVHNQIEPKSRAIASQCEPTHATSQASTTHIQSAMMSREQQAVSMAADVQLPITSMPGNTATTPSEFTSINEHSEALQRHGLCTVSSQDDLDLTGPEGITLYDSPGLIEIAVKKSTSDYYNSNKNQSYSIDHKFRGMALIINVQDDRTGTNVDRDNLTKLFEALDLLVFVKNDEDGLKAQEIEEKIRNFARNDMWKKCSVCVVVIMAHGRNGIIYGTDEDKTYLRDVFAMFDGEHAPLLKGKPKLFIIQACRGGGLDKGIKENFDSHDEVSEYKVPTFDDYVISYATQPGFKAMRNTTYGGWYIQAIIKVFQEYAHKETVDSMLKTVRSVLSTHFSKHSDEHSNIQSSEYTCGLGPMKFNFFPGI